MSEEKLKVDSGFFLRVPTEKWEGAEQATAFFLISSTAFIDV